MISAAVRVGVVGDATRHSGQTKEVHRKEGKIYTNKEGSEVNLRQKFIVSDPKNLVGSVVKPGKDGKHCTHRKDVVKVGYNVVRQLNSSYDEDWTITFLYANLIANKTRRLVSTDPTLKKLLIWFPRDCPINCSTPVLRGL